MRNALWMLAIAACGGEPAARAPVVARVVDAAAVVDTGAMTECPTPAVAKLESWMEVAVPGTYWIEMRHGASGWEPVERVRMPMHHATRLELQNAAEYVAMEGKRARFVVELTAKDVQHDEARHTWFVTYTAWIVEGCELQ